MLLAAMPTALVAPSPANAAVSPAIVLFYKFDAHQGAAVPDTSLSQLTGSLVNSATPDSAYVAHRARKVFKACFDISADSSDIHSS